jgi:hypothetical protein
VCPVITPSHGFRTRSRRPNIEHLSSLTPTVPIHPGTTVLCAGSSEPGDEPLFCERVAGIDIGKQVVSVTIRVPSDTRRGGRQQETREFGTTRRQLLEMADWLRCWQVERAGMEATSDYWKLTRAVVRPRIPAFIELAWPWIGRPLTVRLIS